MRLTCPNCNAQYEVDAAVIPDMGRDVQCSNCGQTWFQHGPHSEVHDDSESVIAQTPPDATISDETAPTDAYAGWEDSAQEAVDDTPASEEPQSWPNLEADLEAELEGAQTAAPAEGIPLETAHPQDIPAPAQPLEEQSPEHHPEPPEATDTTWSGFHSASKYEADQGFDDADDEFDEEYEDTPAPTALPPRRAMDDDLLAVLREEAAREVQARKAEGSALETQTELGLAALSPAAHSKRHTVDRAPAEPTPQVEREARLSGLEEMPDANAPRATRRDLLPDIEEINSTLRATSDRGQRRDAHDPALERPRRSSFRSGFFGVITIALIGLALYLGAPKLAQILPATAPYMARYTETVDSGRLWLDRKMLAITQSMRETPKP